MIPVFSAELIAAAERRRRRPRTSSCRTRRSWSSWASSLLHRHVILWQVGHPADQQGDDGPAGSRSRRSSRRPRKAKAEAAGRRRRPTRPSWPTARAEASRIREEAREQGAADHRPAAASRRRSRPSGSPPNAHAQIEVERAQALSQLKGEVGTIATTLAGRIVGESLDDDERQKRTGRAVHRRAGVRQSGKSKN